MITPNRISVWVQKLLFFSVVLGVPNSAFAVEELPLPSQACSFTGSFTQSKGVTGLAEPLHSEGVFYYHCEAGVIWKTNSPVLQSFVFKKKGKAFSVQHKEVVTLKSAQGKVLGRLLNSLIGGNQGELAEQFEITPIYETEPEEGNEESKPDVKSFILKPRKRSLKRGLKAIELGLKQADSERSVSVDIAMLDRKDQWTRISSIKTSSLDGEENPTQQCSDLGSLTRQECALLHQSP